MHIPILLTALLLPPFFASAQLYIPRSSLGTLAVAHNGKSFVVINCDQKTLHEVQSHNLDRNLRNLSESQQLMFMKKRLGCLKVDQNSKGEYQLELHGRVKGGGPILGGIFYWITKILCWTGVTTAAASVVTGAVASAVATGGATIAPIAVGTGATAMIAVKSGVALALATPLAAPVVAGATAANVVTVAAAAASQIPSVVKASTIGTVAVGIGTTGAKVGIAAGIEAVSCNAFAIGLAFPWW